MGNPSEHKAAEDAAHNESPLSDSQRNSTDRKPANSPSHARPVPLIAWVMGAIASIGGFMFGYESGQISGIMAMDDFKARFADHGKFSPARSGAIVGLLCIGTLIGSLLAATVSDKFGRKYSISFWAFSYIIGTIIEITSEHVWGQFAVGRLVCGFGIGALSATVPMYLSESVAKGIRGAAVASYQLFITLGIWTAYMITYGTEDAYPNSAQWRIPNGLSALWAILLGLSILAMPESPRWLYTKGRVDEARSVMARMNNCDPHDDDINADIADIEQKQQEDIAAGTPKWFEVFTAPRMFYRVALGMTLQAGQQLTGANYFFYYGTTIFEKTGMDNSFVTSIILGSVNVAATFFALWLINHAGRRICLMVGAAWISACLFIYSFIGRYKLDNPDGTVNVQAGQVMIAFTCLAIVAFAITWGPLAWAVVGELYPSRYRATAIGLATASNWLFNFLISFFSTFITDIIDYLFGLVFAVSCFILFFVVYFFMIESKDRSLEEIDTMYSTHVNPITSAKWDPATAGLNSHRNDPEKNDAH